MKVFVDLRPAGIAGTRFAFWDTVVDKFVAYNGSQAWDDWEDFLEDACAINWYVNEKEAKRLMRLVQPWAFEKSV